MEDDVNKNKVMRMKRAVKRLGSCRKEFRKGLVLSKKCLKNLSNAKRKLDRLIDNDAPDRKLNKAKKRIKRFGDCWVRKPDINRWKKNKRRKARWQFGGKCKCENGSTYWVNSRDKRCRNINCFGGKKLSCSVKRHTRFLNNIRVWCWRDPNRTTVNKKKYGVSGGRCYCPDGKKYWAADEKNNCKS